MQVSERHSTLVRRRTIESVWKKRALAPKHSLVFVPARDRERIADAHHIYDAGARDEARSVISHGASHVRPGFFEHVRDKIEDAGTSVGYKTKCPERILRMRREDVPAHQVARHSEPTNSHEDGKRSLPPSKQKVAKAWNKPRDDRDHRWHGRANDP